MEKYITSCNYHSLSCSAFSILVQSRVSSMNENWRVLLAVITVKEMEVGFTTVLTVSGEECVKSRLFIHSFSGTVRSECFYPAIRLSLTTLQAHVTFMTVFILISFVFLFTIKRRNNFYKSSSY